MSSSAAPYLIWWPWNTLVAFAWYCLFSPSLFSKKPMPPPRSCGVTRVSVNIHVLTLGTSMVLFLARAHDASRRNELVSTPSYLITWLCPPNFEKLLKRDVSFPASALLRCGPTGALPGSPKNDTLMLWFCVAWYVAFVEYDV